MDRTEAILRGLIEVARPLILGSYRADSCIASTAIGVAVLQYFSIRAWGQAVNCVVLNAEANELMRKLPPTELQEIMSQQKQDAPGGPWGIKIAADPSDSVGHVVINVNNRYLVDLSIDQVNRSHKNIILEPGYISTPPEWWQSDDQIVLQVNDCAVFYRIAHLDSWKKSSNNKMTTLNKLIAGQIIRKIKSQTSLTSSSDMVL